jgi:WD40 repeat protein
VKVEKAPPREEKKAGGPDFPPAQAQPLPEDALTPWRETIPPRPAPAALTFPPDDERTTPDTYRAAVALWTGPSRRDRMLQEGGATVRAVAFSPDGRSLASADAAGVAIVWKLESLHREQELLAGQRALAAAARWATLVDRDGPRNAGQAHAVLFTPDGRFLIAAGKSDPDGALRGSDVLAWDVARRRVGKVFQGAGDVVAALALSPDGKTLAAGCRGGTVTLWDWASGRTLRTLRHEGGSVHSIAFSAGGSVLASAGSSRAPWDGAERGELNLWDVHSGRKRGTVWRTAGAVTAVAFGADGTRLAAGESEGAIKLWDLTRGDAFGPHRLYHGPVTTALFSPDSRTLATASASRVVLVDSARGEWPRPLKGRDNPVRGLAFSPDGRSLASGDSDGCLTVWDAASGAAHAVWGAHETSILAVAFSPDGGTLASSAISARQHVMLWDVASCVDRARRRAELEQERQRLRAARKAATLVGHARAVTAVAFHPSGKIVATGGADWEVKFWDLTTAKARMTRRGHAGEVSGVAFSPDGKLFASAALDILVILRDTATGKERASFAGHQHACAVTFSQDGKTLVTGGADDFIRFWDVDQGEEWASLEAHQGGVVSLALAREHGILASGGRDGTVKLWDAGTRKERTVLRGHTGPVACLALTGNGRLLVSGGGHRPLWLWDATTGKPHGKAPWHSDPVTAAALSPDGCWLATGTRDGEVQLWEMPKAAPGKQ